MLSKEQIIDLLQYIDVDKIGHWKGDKIQFCCPIHHESNPSCGINADFTTGNGEHLQVYNCFSCGSSGSLPKFLYLSMPDKFKNIAQAINFLENRYHIKYSYSPREHNIHLNVKRYDDFGFEVKEEKIAPLTSLAVFKSGKETYSYFFERGFDKGDLVEYKIGRDLFEHTITIPIFYQNGALAGVIGRYIDPNIPKNARFKVYDFEKSKVLYLLDKVEIDNSTIICVESAFDAMMLRKWGYFNSVAILGNKLSDAQADLLCGVCQKVILLFDNDSGGRTAITIAKDKLKGKVQILIPSYYPEYGKDVCEWGELETAKVIKSCSYTNNFRIFRL